ncbi:hypothetical protein [Rhodococcus sp. NPDC058521]|uniref:hypothetical protein n=1 Tax=Rhodococcus sp. NPDC058521 TaxID=3346536 RepID=UPI0036613E4B
MIVSYLRERNEVTAGFGLQMLAWTPGGDAYSGEEYQRWLAEAGYGEVRIHHLTEPPQSMVFASTDNPGAG